MPPRELRRRLTQWRVSVIAEETDASVDSLVAAGLRAELVRLDDYPVYALAQMPAPPPTWELASHTLELALLPSFANEAVLRLCSSGETSGSIQIADAGVQVWQRYFNLSAWYADPSREFPTQPDPFEERVELDLPVDALIERVSNLTHDPPKQEILDGVSYLLQARSPGRSVTHRGHGLTPTHQPKLFQLVTDLLRIVRAAVNEPRGQRILKLLASPD